MCFNKFLSTNDGQKCHFFLVPRDPILLVLCQGAVLPNDIVLRQTRSLRKAFLARRYKLDV